MEDWKFAHTNPSDELARLHFFSIKKKLHSGREIEFIITVKEFVKPKEPTMLFFAQSDKQTNQQVAPYTPCGWGMSMLAALSECVQSINRFPYQEPDSPTGATGLRHE